MKTILTTLTLFVCASAWAQGKPDGPRASRRTRRKSARKAADFAQSVMLDAAQARALAQAFAQSDQMQAAGAAAALAQEFAQSKQPGAEEFAQIAQVDAARKAGEFAREFAQSGQVEARKAREAARVDREDSSYRRGTRSIERREYEQAIEAFDGVVEAKSSRADGALYWKAYAQNKLGRRDQALATLSALQKEYPQSRWLNDAKGLEVEVKQASGRPVSPDAEADDDLKLLAINGLMTNNSARALPLLQKVMNDPKTSPRVKERALFVLAQSPDPKGREILLQIAKGGANPDMQLKAVEYLGVFGRGNGQLLSDIYSSSSDPSVKRAVIHGFMMANDTDRLLNIAKTEQQPELRREAIHTLGMIRRDTTGPALVALYGSQLDPAVEERRWSMRCSCSRMRKHSSTSRARRRIRI